MKHIQKIRVLIFFIFKKKLQSIFGISYLFLQVTAFPFLKIVSCSTSFFDALFIEISCHLLRGLPDLLFHLLVDQKFFSTHVSLWKGEKMKICSTQGDLNLTKRNQTRLSDVDHMRASVVMLQTHSLRHNFSLFVLNCSLELL